MRKSPRKTPYACYCLLLIAFVGCSQNKLPTEAAPGDTWESPKDGMVLVFVPAGEFDMGSNEAEIEFALEKCNEIALIEHPEEGDCPPEWYDLQKPVHGVYLDAYWIDQTEVTNAMFAQFVEETGYETDAEKMGKSLIFSIQTEKGAEVTGADWQHPHGPDTSIQGLENHPVVQVSWNDAVAYCTWAGRRLPTEAEWEKAARWNPETSQAARYPWGDQNPTEKLLNYGDKNLGVAYADMTQDDGYQYTAPVGSYPAGTSYYGVLDMAGNVFEWVQDYRSSLYYGQSAYENPQGPVTGTYRVLRGGSWNGDVRVVMAADRSQGLYPTKAINWAGFRCALLP
ncbi:MAG: formylglycine-generating enzyme family protein [Ardenticatenaceae bacterium]|nr:formylglycine-generating enzyme family protein [Ardenticatenaceae bacterium]